MEEKKEANNKMITFLVAAVLVILSVVVYFVLKQPENVATPQEKPQNTEQTEMELAPPASSTAPVAQPEVETPEETDERETIVDHSDEIESDLNSLDSLDLSTPENDLGDDKISDL